MIEKSVKYHDEHGTTFHGHLVYDGKSNTARPAVLVIHDWSGCNQFAKEKAKFLASLGYTAFAVDMYGEGMTGNTRDEKVALMQPLLVNRALITQRLLAAMKTLKSLPVVDTSKIGAIGFCFGGLCALDLARSSADIQGVVSFHGLLNPPENAQKNTIKAKVLALHGHDDPMASPEQVNAFMQEMTEAKADWQVHIYGQTMHAFTNPEANDPSFGTVYKELAAQRAFLSMQHFFTEVFA